MKITSKKLIRTAGLLAILLSFVLSFAAPGDAQASEPAGVWRGEWRSGSTGHHGPMRAVIKPTADGTYQARFTGRFALVIPFAYRVQLQPQLDYNGNTILTAEKPLGPLLGSYRMSAQATGNGLYGSFQAAGDNGSIRMQRVR
jgi:hypothetical protein